MIYLLIYISISINYSKPIYFMSLLTCSSHTVYDVLITLKELNEYNILIGLLRATPNHILHIYNDIIKNKNETKILRIVSIMVVDEYNWPMLAVSMSPLSDEERTCLQSRFPHDDDLLNSLIKNS